MLDSINFGFFTAYLCTVVWIPDLSPILRSWSKCKYSFEYNIQASSIWIPAVLLFHSFFLEVLSENY
jgi:hypothetical protein